MRRRFGGRKKRGSGDGRETSIDVERSLAQIVEAGLVPVSALEKIEPEGITNAFAAIGKGAQEDGSEVLVAYSPTSGGDAALAALAAAAGPPGEANAPAFGGTVFAIAPQWSQVDVRRLGAFRETPFEFRTLSAPQLADEPGRVAAELPADPVCLSASQVAAHIVDPAQRALFLRAAASLEGLAAKHGGAIRGVGQAVELVLLGRRVAELRTDNGVVLNTILPQRASTPLSEDDLAEAFDRFEGQLRKRLNDRKARDGEEGMRTRVIPLLTQVGGLRGTVAWPLGGADRDSVDVVGIDEAGYPVIGAIRAQLTLAECGAILDAALALRLSLPLLFVEARPPLRLDSPRLALAAQEFAASVVKILPLLALGHELFEVRAARTRGYELASVTAGDAPPIRTRPDAGRGEGGARPERSRPPRDSDDSRERGRGRRRGRGGRTSSDEEAVVDAPDEVAAASAGENDETSEAPTRGRGRSRGRGRRKSAADPTADPAAGEGVALAGTSQPEQPSGPRFDEMSSFDLDDDSGNADFGGSDDGSRRRRRGRSRRRGGRRPGADGDGDSGDRGARSQGSDDGSASADPGEIDEELEVEVEVDDLEEILAPLPDDVSDLQLELRPSPSYDDDAEPDEVVEAVAPAIVSPEPAKAPRRRVAIVAHADRDSVISAIMLARDIRLLEGLWVYPQSDLMTFFRSVAIDLREGTPVYLIGFTPSPAGEVLASAALFADRLTWFDHHEWPPEDLEAIRQITGDDGLHVTAGAGTSLPAILKECTRRSRFSDKLVDLATGRFTQHDFERWGRLWLTRLSRIAETPGERRSDIDSLLSGRPSDLAKESALVDTPAIPQEVDFVSQRDFRLVHFSGHTLVVLEVPSELDVHLTSRIARERYGASLSLAIVKGEDRAIMGGSESGSRRSLNLSALVEHLDAKFGWIAALPDEDYVARFLIRDLEQHPERLDDVIGMIAMGRSIIER